jgi:predicted  nucleic acid-binding Zn-ribbon protein
VKAVKKQSKLDSNRLLVLASIFVYAAPVYANQADLKSTAEKWVICQASDDSRVDLQRTRDSLLRERDQLSRSYNDTLQQIDDRNKEIARLNANAAYIQSALSRNQQSLSDVEKSLQYGY